MWRFLGGILSPIFPLWQQHWSTDSSTGSVWPCDFSSVIVQPEKGKSCSSTAGIVPSPSDVHNLVTDACATNSHFQLHQDTNGRLILNQLHGCQESAGHLSKVEVCCTNQGAEGDQLQIFSAPSFFWCTLIDMKESLHDGKGKEHRKPVGTWRQYLPDGGQSCVSLTVKEAALIIWIIRFFYTDLGFFSLLPTVPLSLMSLFQVWLLKPLWLHFPKWNSPAQSVSQCQLWAAHPASHCHECSQLTAHTGTHRGAGNRGLQTCGLSCHLTMNPDTKFRSHGS